MPADSFSQLDLSCARMVDRLCDRFEQAWRHGERPRIEDHLATQTEGIQAALLSEMLRVELWYRRAAGEHPTAAEYLRHFPAIEGIAGLIRDLSGGDA